MFEPPHKHNAKVSLDAARVRAKLLALLPNEFTTKSAQAIWNIPISKVNHQLRMMRDKNEIIVISAYKNPTTYAKLEKPK